MNKSALRKELRKLRSEHVAALPDVMRGLVFRHPPAPLLSMIGDEATIGLYHAMQDEAPTTAYAGFFQERGNRIALPRFHTPESVMHFAEHSDPYGESDLEDAAFGIRQPSADASEVVPDLLFVPLIGFTERGERLGQGGGHYDRWLEQYPDTPAIGLAWDCQRLEQLPVEPHDRPLTAVVTPTRLYGPF